MKNYGNIFFLSFSRAVRLILYFSRHFSNCILHRSLFSFLSARTISRDPANAYAITKNVLEKTGRDVGIRNEEKKGHESPPMNHSRRYRSIWTSSPACSKHVYLRFRVSTSRHCHDSFSFFLPYYRCIDIAEVRRRWSRALNGTFVDPPTLPGGDRTNPPARKAENRRTKGETNRKRSERMKKEGERAHSLR